MRTSHLLLLWLCCLPLGGCSSCVASPETQITRLVHATVAEDGETVLVVRSSYRTSSPDAPHFNDVDARDWRISLWETDLQGLDDPDSWSPRNTWTEPVEGPGGGTLANHALYYHKGQGRLAYNALNSTWVVDVDAGAPRELRIPDAELTSLLGSTLGPGTSPRDPVLSPDGAYVGSVWISAYEAGMFDLRFKVIGAVFDAADASLVRAEVLEFMDDGVDPDLSPPTPIQHPWRAHLLWDQDASGFRVVGTSQAWRVPVDPQAPVEAVTEVPAIALPTSSWPVTGDGVALHITETGTNTTELRRTTLPTWTPFQEIMRVPLETVTYAR